MSCQKEDFSFSYRELDKIEHAEKTAVKNNVSAPNTTH